MMYAKFIVTSGRIVFGEDAEVRACHGRVRPFGGPDWHYRRGQVHFPGFENGMS